MTRGRRRFTDRGPLEPLEGGRDQRGLMKAVQGLRLPSDSMPEDHTVRKPSPWATSPWVSPPFNHREPDRGQVRRSDTG